MARLVDLNNRDIDALQTKALRPQHWWKDPPTLIALLALLVSMISPVVAQRNVASDREREDQRQLTDLVQQLPGLAEGEPDELVVVADTANRLMERVPSTPTQKLEVATALLKSGYLEDARRLLEDAASESTEQLEMSAISQRFANLHFQVEDLDEGRAAYDRAIRLAREALPEVAQPNYVGRYEVYWATDELYYADDCQEAAMHAIRAGDVVAQNEDRVDTDDLQGRIDALKGEIVERCA
jgi:tetratricopeptide (TPR) repeat protein